jgi:4-amino-4-deoxy-L-arabinose transferase-like glycosyltransferase
LLVVRVEGCYNGPGAPLTRVLGGWLAHQGAGQQRLSDIWPRLLARQDGLRELRVTKGRRAAALLLLVAALALATLGQYYFFRRRDYLWDGLVLHGLAVICFGLAWRLASARELRPSSLRTNSLRFSELLTGRPIPTVLMLLGLFLCITATLLSQRRAWNQVTSDVVLLWLLGIGMALAAAAWPWVTGARLRGRWQDVLSEIDRGRWLEIATLAALTLLALILRVAALESVPYTLGGDEAWHGLLARQVLDGELRNPFVMGYMSMPTLFYWPLSWSLQLVGNNVIGLRLPAALAGTATVPILYLLARRLWGRRIAALSALFLATYDYHIHYSRLGANNVWDTLFVLLTLWLLDLGLTSPGRQQQIGLFTLAGLAMGFSVYFYTGARLLPLLAITYIGFVWIKRKRSQDQGLLSTGKLVWPLFTLILAFVIASGPMLSYALLHPDDWSARINQVGIIQSGWLAREPGLTGKSLSQILAEQFFRAAGAFHVFRDRTAWYGASRPLLGPLPGAFAILGMGWSLFHWRERRYFLVLIWFWSVIITGGMLTESPPSSQRLVIAIPSVALLVAIGLDRAVALLRRIIGTERDLWESAVLTVVAAILVVSNVRFYFVEFTPTRSYGTANGETATMMGQYLGGLEGDYHAYFFGAPRIYWGFGTMAFLAPDVPGEDVVEPLGGPPNIASESERAVFLFLPERAVELDWVRQAFPGGTARDFYDPAGQLRFIAYEVPIRPGTSSGVRLTHAEAVLSLH